MQHEYDCEPGRSLAVINMEVMIIISPWISSRIDSTKDRWGKIA